MSDNLTTYSAAELLKRNGITMPVVWIGYKGNIYDVTSSDLFDNGKHYQHLNGTDLTAFMPDAPHMDDVMDDFEVVGLIEGGSPAAGSKYKKPASNKKPEIKSYTPSASTNKSSPSQVSQTSKSSTKITYEPYAGNKSTPKQPVKTKPLEVNNEKSSKIKYSNNVNTKAPIQKQTFENVTTKVKDAVTFGTNKPVKPIIKKGSFTAVFTEKLKISNDCYRLFFNVDTNEFNFEPGQYVKLTITIKGKEYERSYSMASLPNDEVLEFVVQRKKGGVISNYLINNLNEGEIINFKGPYGDIAFKNENINDELFFICTDVGIGPVRSVIIDILKNNRTRKPVNLIYGNKKLSDLLYKDEWFLLEKLYPNFTLLPSFSKESNPPIWSLKGYLHPLYLNEIQHKPNAHFYIVGWQRMVKESKSNLKELGYAKDCISTQLYI